MPQRTFLMNDTFLMIDWNRTSAAVVTRLSPSRSIKQFVKSSKFNESFFQFFFIFPSSIAHCIAAPPRRAKQEQRSFRSEGNNCRRFELFHVYFGLKSPFSGWSLFGSVDWLSRFRFRWCENSAKSKEAVNDRFRLRRSRCSSWFSGKLQTEKKTMAECRNIRVAVRVRPLNRRELEQNQRNIIKVCGRVWIQRD